MARLHVFMQTSGVIRKWNLLLVLCPALVWGQQHIPLKSQLEAYDIHYYHFDLNISNANSEIAGFVHLEATLKNTSTDSITLELTQHAQLDSVICNGNRVTYKHTNDLIRLPLEACQGMNQPLSITVYYSISRYHTPYNRGITSSTLANGRRITWSLSEPRYAKDWFPCKQVLEDKIDSATLYFTVPDTLMVGSNGILTGITPMECSRKRFEWKTSYPTAYYLFSFATGNYMDYSFDVRNDDSGQIHVQNFIYNDSIFFKENKRQIDTTAALLRIYTKLFGPYPFAAEKYGHCMAPIGGGMEHQTMTTLGSFNIELVAHELAHQWFGNSVTCSDWQNIWINEGFASYAEYLAFEELGVDEKARTWLSNAHALVSSMPSGSVYVPAQELDDDQRIFNYRLSYQKGALLLHMIRHDLGNDSLFFDLIKDYVKQHTYGNADGSAFREILEAKSGRDYASFFNSWYYGEGFPILDIEWVQKSDSVGIRIQQESSLSKSSVTYPILLDLKLEFLSGDTLLQVPINRKETSMDLFVSKKLMRLTPDPYMRTISQIRSVTHLNESNSSKAFQVFPNPAANQVYIQNYIPDRPFEVQLLDQSGNRLARQTNCVTYTSFPLSHLCAGIYRLVTSQGNAQEVFTLIKL